MQRPFDAFLTLMDSLPIFSLEVKTLFAIAALSFLASCAPYDPVESTFYVAGKETPSWYTNAQNQKTQIKYNIHTSGRVDVTVQKGDFRKQKLTGTYEGVLAPPIPDAPTGRSYPKPGYPQRLLITVQGKTDVYEQRAMEPYIYVVEKDVH